MKMSPEQAKFVQKIVAEKCKNTPCPSCESEPNWLMSDRIYGLPELHPHMTTTSSPYSPFQSAMPIVALYCKNCGYMRTYNAIWLGIIDATGRWING